MVDLSMANCECHNQMVFSNDFFGTASVLVVMYPVVFHVPSGSAPLLVNQHGQHGQHGQVSGAISLVAVTELEAGSWELADVTMVTGRTFTK
jgi:hypothetical protein